MAELTLRYFFKEKNLSAEDPSGSCPQRVFYLRSKYNTNAIPTFNPALKSWCL